MFKLFLIAFVSIQLIGTVFGVCVPDCDNGFCVTNTCICDAGFYGTSCELEKYECGSNPCQNGGTCLDLIDAFLCKCASGFTGTLCEIGSNPCASNPCGTGTCVITGSPNFPFVCKCPDGSALLTPCTATTTTTAITSTTTTTTSPSVILCPFQSICNNNGVCYITVSNNNIECRCSAGFSGTYCEISAVTTTTTTTTRTTISTGVTPVLCPNQLICQNQGVCYIYGSTFVCVCPQGYYGLYCESSLTTTTAKPIGCAINPCRNSGTCVTKADGSFLGCFCQTGYIGTFCETYQGVVTTTSSSVFTCNPSPCWYGQCVGDNNNKFLYCNCISGYYGAYCDLRNSIITTAIMPATTGSSYCATVKCMNGGVCTSKGCICSSGYSGQYCETLSTGLLCQNIACSNGGVCNVKSLTMAECVCPTGYGGYYCEVRYAANRCNEVQCLNGAVCEEYQPGVTIYAYCMCKAGYIGTRCETEYFKCTSNGNFKDIYGCTHGRYLECTNGILSRRDCSPGLRYNTSLGYCDYSSNVQC